MTSTDSVKEFSLNEGRSKSTESSLKPILLSMKIFGMYFDPNPGTNRIEDSQNVKEKNKKRFTWVGYRAYSYLTLLMLWANFVRSVVGMFPLDTGASITGIVAMWYLLCAVNTTIIVMSCHNGQRFLLFYKHWDIVMQDRSTESINCRYLCTLRVTKVASVIGWIFVFVFATIIDFVILETFPNFQEITSLALRPFRLDYWNRAITAVLVLYECAAWVFPGVLVISMSRMIRKQFIQFKECLLWHVEEAKEFLPSHLAELRSYYLKLCKAVEIINETFKWMLGVSFLLVIFMACFTSYQLVAKQDDVATTLMFLFYLGACFLYIAALCLDTSELRDAAQSSLGVLLTVGTRGATPEQLGQLNLFLTKLSAAPVGFTIVDFFLITKEFLLTVTGLYLTYFFMILQFKIA